jgi:DnaJ-class molecular chaperone
MITCKTCHGLKTIIGMGHMRIKCTSCSGKGTLPDAPEKVEQKTQAPEIPTKKLSAKKKWQQTKFAKDSLNAES